MQEASYQVSFPVCSTEAFLFLLAVLHLDMASTGEGRQRQEDPRDR